MHFRRRAPRDVPGDTVPAFLNVKTIVREAAHESQEFVVETNDGQFEWRTLPLDNERVKNFVKDQPPAEPLPVVQTERWIAGGEIINDPNEADAFDDV